MKINRLAATIVAILPAAVYAQLGDDSAYGRATMTTASASPVAAAASAGQGAVSEVSTDHGMRWRTGQDESGWSRSPGASAPQPDTAADSSASRSDLYRANGL